MMLTEFRESNAMFCDTSDNGKKCTKCKNFRWEMDACVCSGFIAGVYALLGDHEVKFEEGEPPNTPQWAKEVTL